MADQPLSPDVIAAIAQQAGLTLNDEQFADLVASYRLYEPVLARLRRDWPYSAEPAHVFDPRSCMPRDGAKT